MVKLASGKGYVLATGKGQVSVIDKGSRVMVLVRDISKGPH